MVTEDPLAKFKEADRSRVTWLQDSKVSPLSEATRSGDGVALAHSCHW
jgi:hypothetical protein